MAQHPGIFPTFFLSGFECSTFVWKEQGRRNLIAETQHDRHALEDYRILHDLGIGVAREGIPWPLVEGNGTYNFHCIDSMIDALRQTRVLPIWDLCHYGYPEAADPFQPDFADRFANYCRAAAKYVSDRLDGPYFFTPINEITFFAFCGGEWGWVAPYRHSREERHALRLQLCQAAIQGVLAIREVLPKARMIHVDPLVQVVAPRDRPDLEAAAHHETYVDTFLGWDILCGLAHPDLGGSPGILDIVGVNNYSFGQMEYREKGPHKALDPHDDRIKPLCDLLTLVWERYRRPMVIAETSGMGKGRDEWFNDVMEESLAAVAMGIDLHGICLFPAVDMPDWHTGKWLHNGICDLVAEGDELKRVPDAHLVAEIHRWQKELNRVTRLDEDPLSDPVELQDVVEAARRLQKRPDNNWH